MERHVEVSPAPPRGELPLDRHPAAAVGAGAQLRRLPGVGEKAEPVDHAAIARACGVNGVRVEDPADYGDALDRALAADSTTVIDVITDPGAYPPITAFEGRL